VLKLAVLRSAEGNLDLCQRLEQHVSTQRAFDESLLGVAVVPKSAAELVRPRLDSQPRGPLRCVVLLVGGGRGSVNRRRPISATAVRARDWTDDGGTASDTPSAWVHSLPIEMWLCLCTSRHGF
jgi:hypothetical protein